MKRSEPSKCIGCQWRGKSKICEQCMPEIVKKAKKMRLNPIAKTERRSLEDQADKLWSNAVLLRDNGICRKCGKPGNNPHHIITRSVKHLRHSLENGLCLCPGCHTLGSGSAHKAPELFRDWLIGEIGAEALETLKRESQMVRKPDYRAAIMYLESYLREGK